MVIIQQPKPLTQREIDKAASFAVAVYGPMAVGENDKLARKRMASAVKMVSAFPPVPMWLREWQAEVKATGGRKPTQSGYASFARSFERAFEHPPTPGAVQQWLDTRGAPGTKTRDNAWKRCHAFLAWVERVYDIPNPMRKLRKPRLRKVEPRWFSKEEVAAIVAAVETDLERAMLATYLGLGLRLAEGLGLQPEDVRADRLAVHNGKERDESVPLTDALRADLLGGIPFGFEKDTAGRRLKELYRRAGIQVGKSERIGSHVLRHTFMSLWQEAGGNPYMAGRILRHSDRTQDGHYTHFTPEQLRQALALYGPLAYVRRDTTRG